MSVEREAALDTPTPPLYREFMRPHSSSRLLALCAALLSLTACAARQAASPPAPAPPVAARPAAPKAFLWEVTRPDEPDRPLYLTGSIHAGRPGQFAFPPAFERVIARAEALVLEVDPREAERPELQRLTLQLGLYQPPESLSGRLDPKTRALLPAALGRIGLTPQSVDGLRPWMLAATLAVIELQRAGYDAKGGIDALLHARFGPPRAVVALETAEGQLRTLADLPEPVQHLMLRDALESGPATALSLAQIASAWEGGNPDALASTMFERAKDPELAPMYEAVFYARNRTMAEKLAPLAGAPRIHLAVVGAGHVVGEQGVLALLAARGLRVRQLDRE